MGVFAPGRVLRSSLNTWRGALRRSRSNAIFIAITGSSLKSTTAALLSHVLSQTAPTLLQLKSNRHQGRWRTMSAVQPEHRYAIWEIASEGPGTIQPSIDRVKPSIGIVTLVGLEHYSQFKTYEAVAEEKSALVKALPEDGLAVLNYDDARVAAMAPLTKARIVTFGASGGDYQIEDVRADRPGELGLSIRHHGEICEVTTQFTGGHFSLGVAAAFACAHQLGLSPSAIREAIASFAPVFGRCSMHAIENGPTFILDTVKAPHYSIYIPIEMMAQFDAPRKRIVVGQMSDFVGSSSKYRDVYRASARVSDQVIFVGDSAHRSKATMEERAAGRFVEIRNVEQAARFIKETAIPGEIILLKSSANLHLERIMLQFQEGVRCWEQKCRRKTLTCVRCGLYGRPYEEHTGGSRKQFGYSSVGPRA